MITNSMFENYETFRSLKDREVENREIYEVYGWGSIPRDGGGDVDLADYPLEHFGDIYDDGPDEIDDTWNMLEEITAE